MDKVTTAIVKTVIFTGPKRKAHHTTGGAVCGICILGLVRRQGGDGKLQPWAFIMVSKRRTGRGKISKLKIG